MDKVSLKLCKFKNYTILNFKAFNFKLILKLEVVSPDDDSILGVIQKLLSLTRWNFVHNNLKQ